MVLVRSWFVRQSRLWLYQQFLKIKTCRHCDQRLPIWDADTIPIKKIHFVDNDDTLNPFASDDK